MHKFNLNKYYTLNILAYFSLITNIFYIFYGLYLFKIYPQTHPNSWSIDPIVYSAIYYGICFLIYAVILLTSIVELILRNYKRITKYNTLYMPKFIYSFLYWLGVLLTPSILFIWYFLINLISIALAGD